ncbi:TetR/AcrR family transcriptional regulator [Hwanghaeella grinnelliae]|uniref:TetR/AcrR family transcriptional regulator n=1 Tax=Hwanghaeella grinnelliae TaxID=2500179 RepID=A0A437QGP8_9PROT|nr:TetR/AcrR family transcriptional regulator [Hwanghaeella grinnelliae]RVU33739.1 TetR/AcrR family transcriptional regulator [Hwanghaeella grinnelliae]
MSSMMEKEILYAEAAGRVIERYGMKRTTMGDIAKEAGVSRQTLYTVYPSKEDVLRGIIRLSCGRTSETIEVECAKQVGVEAKLTTMFEHMTLAPYRMIAAMPDAADFLIGFKDAATCELDRAYDRYAETLRGILSPYEKPIEATGLTVDRLANYVITSAKTFKKEARDEDELVEMLEVLKRMVISITG